MPMPNEFWATIVGALVGAGAGGAISYWLQSQNLQASERQRQKEAEEWQKALGHGLIFKMVRIYSGLENMRRHLAESFSKLENPELKGWEPWQVVLPIPNVPETVSFSTDEMAMLPAEMEGTVGQIHLPREQAMYVRPKMVELNELLVGMIERCTQDATQAGGVLHRLNECLNDKLKLKISISPKRTNGK